MSSGNYAGKAGFNNTEKPNAEPRCIPLLPDPRGPEWLLAGLCTTCGHATARRGPDGRADCRGQLTEAAVKPIVRGQP